MKIPFRCNDRLGITLVELLVILAILAILSGFLIPHGHRAPHKAARIRCVNNLKQVGMSFRLYAEDNGNRYPMNISTNDEPAVNETTPVFTYFDLIQKRLETPKVVVCPADKERYAVDSFNNLSNSNLSYFIGLDADETLPRSMLAGDRNITNGFSPRNGILDLSTNRMAGFTDEIHKKQGNIALGDGSVQQVSSARLRSEIIQNAPFATNRIKLP